MALTTTELCLVRHGSTEMGAAGRLCGTGDPPVDVEGRRQAEAARATLAGRSFDRVWSSDLRRAVETATIIARGTPTVDPRLRELDFGTLEGKRWDECPLEIQEALVEFEDFVAPGGESVASLRARIEDFLAGLRPGRHLIVTHGGVIRCLLLARGENRTVEPGEVVELTLP